MSKLNTEALLAKDKNERMWFFLKGCIPTERTNAIFVMLSNISPDFVNDNGDIVVPGIAAVFHFVGCGKDIKQKVWLTDSTL